jgi:hypothetical protein
MKIVETFMNPRSIRVENLRGWLIVEKIGFFPKKSDFFPKKSDFSLHDVMLSLKKNQSFLLNFGALSPILFEDYFWHVSFLR